MKGLAEIVYGYVFPLLSLWKYTGKWGHTWREMGECGERWNEKNGFLMLYIIFLCFVKLVVLVKRTSEPSF